MSLRPKLYLTSCWTTLGLERGGGRPRPARTSLVRVFDVVEVRRPAVRAHDRDRLARAGPAGVDGGHPESRGGGRLVELTCARQGDLCVDRRAVRRLDSDQPL